MHSPWSTCMSLLFSVMYFALFLPNSKGPHKTCNQRSNGKQQLTLGSPPEPEPIFSDFPVDQKVAPSWHTSVTVMLTSQGAHTDLRGSHLSYTVFMRTKAVSPREALSRCFFYPKPFLYFTVPSFNKHTLKVTWTRAVNIFCTKSRTHTFQTIPERPTLVLVLFQ